MGELDDASGLVSHVNFPSISKTISRFQFSSVSFFQFSSEIEKHCPATLEHLGAVLMALQEVPRDWRVRACRGPQEQSRVPQVGG